MTGLPVMLLVALGAAAGAPLRYALAHLLDGEWPIGTLVANAVGSALVGLFAALSLDGSAWALLATGFCGAFTSFSSFAVQTVERPATRAAAYTVVTVVLAVGLCVLGFVAGSVLG